MWVMMVLRAGPGPPNEVLVIAHGGFSTMTKWILIAAVPLTLCSLGCDRDSAPDGELGAELVERVADEPADGEASPERMRHGSPVERICSLVACSEDQRTQVDALLDKARADRPTRHGSAKAAANEALAAKFRGEGLTAEDLRDIEAAASQIAVQGARYPEHLERMTGR